MSEDKSGLEEAKATKAEEWSDESWSEAPRPRFTRAQSVSMIVCLAVASVLMRIVGRDGLNESELVLLAIPLAVALGLAFLERKWAESIIFGYITVAFLLTSLASGYLWSLHYNGIETSSLLFVAVPALLAIGFVHIPAHTSGWVISKGITMSLLLSGVLLGEGVICILMAAPIFYLIGFFVYLLARKGPESRIKAVVWLPLLIMSAEGTHESLSFERANTVTATKVLQVSPEALKKRLQGPLKLQKAGISKWLALFPMPVKSEAACGHVGCVHSVEFSKGKGDKRLIYKIEAIGKDSIHFRVIRDQSKAAHWLTWTRFKIRWKKIDTRKVRVVWSASFRRELDPCWYFAPIERGVVSMVLQDLLVHLGRK